jgi:hypothetical protein
MQAHILPDNSPSETKAIQWYFDLLLNKKNKVDDMIGVENGILVAYGMSPPYDPPCFAT